MNINKIFEKYTLINFFDEHYNICLVQDETGTKFVYKSYDYYYLEIYDFIKNNNVKGVPKIIEYFKEDGYLHVIEEYIAGDNLNNLKMECKMDFLPDQVINIVSSLCDTLEVFHRNNIVNRDIKPSNIVLSENGDVYLVDFNTARYIDGSKSSLESRNHGETIFAGTEKFATPEQYGFGELGPQTDIMQLGEVMTFLLTGETYREAKGKLHGKMKNIINKCMRLDAKDRYKSLYDLKCALHNADSRYYFWERDAYMDMHKSEPDIQRGRMLTTLGRYYNLRPMMVWLCSFPYMIVAICYIYSYVFSNGLDKIEKNIVFLLVIVLNLILKPPYKSITRIKFVVRKIISTIFLGILTLMVISVLPANAFGHTFGLIIMLVLSMCI